MIYLTIPSRSLGLKTYTWVKKLCFYLKRFGRYERKCKIAFNLGSYGRCYFTFSLIYVQVFNPKERDGIVKNIIRSIFYPLGGVREIQRNSPFEIHVKFQAPWGRSKKMKLENFFYFIIQYHYTDILSYVHRIYKNFVSI